MGAEFDFAELNAKSIKEALAEGQDLIETCRFVSGHGGYTGTFAEASGCSYIEATDLKTSQDAYNFLIDRCIKWGPALIVEIEGKYYMGAWCSS